MSRGTEVHGEASGDLSTATEITLYEAGSTTARALASTETLVITDVVVSVTAIAGGRVQVFMDADDDNAVDAGETVVDLTMGQNTSISVNFTTPREGKRGAKPHAIGPNATRLAIVGYILRA